ncbi:MAG: MBL fold metallo-hydrolase [Pseudomonadota bacterium]
MNRRSLLKLGLAAPVMPLTLHLVPAAYADGHTDITQVVGVQNFRVGDWIVTALLDGAIPLGPGNFANLTEEEAQSFAEAAFLDTPDVSTGVNAYVLRNGQETILVDAGGAGAFPGLGGLSAALSAAQIEPASVTRILLTHMHPDHIGGLLGADGAAFPNASLHVHAADLGFWTNAEIKAQVSEDFQPFFDLAMAVAGAYGDKIQTFDRDGNLIPGIRTRALPGHTPGHTGFELSSGDDALLIWGDIVHVAAFQFPKPDAVIGFDVDAQAAIETRRAVLAEAAESRVPVAGMHLPFPGVGYISEDGDGYRFTPKAWSFSV